MNVGIALIVECKFRTRFKETIYDNFTYSFLLFFFLLFYKSGPGFELRSYVRQHNTHLLRPSAPFSLQMELYLLCHSLAVKYFFLWKDIEYVAPHLRRFLSLSHSLEKYSGNMGFGSVCKIHCLTLIFSLEFYSLQ